jgi:hypothetical protein
MIRLASFLFSTCSPFSARADLGLEILRPAPTTRHSRESSKLNPPSLRSGSRSDVYRQFITKEIISSRLVSYFKLFGRGPGWAAVGRSILEATESTKVVRQDYAAADQL